MIEINLLEGLKSKKIESHRTEGAPWMFLGVVVGVIVAMIIITIYTAVSVKSLEAKKAQLVNIQREVAKIQAKLGEVRLMIKTIKHLEKDRFLSVKILKDCGDSIPNGLWLTYLSENKNRLSIMGEAFTAEAVAMYMNNLGSLSYVKRVSFAGSGLVKNNSYKNTTVYSFNLIVELK